MASCTSFFLQGTEPHLEPVQWSVSRQLPPNRLELNWNPARAQVLILFPPLDQIFLISAESATHNGVLIENQNFGTGSPKASIGSSI